MSKKLFSKILSILIHWLSQFEIHTLWFGSSKINELIRIATLLHMYGQSPFKLLCHVKNSMLMFVTRQHHHQFLATSLCCLACVCSRVNVSFVEYLQAWYFYYNLSIGMKNMNAEHDEVLMQLCATLLPPILLKHSFVNEMHLKLVYHGIKVCGCF